MSTSQNEGENTVGDDIEMSLADSTISKPVDSTTAMDTSGKSDTHDTQDTHDTSGASVPAKKPAKKKKKKPKTPPSPTSSPQKKAKKDPNKPEYPKVGTYFTSNFIEFHDLKIVVFLQDMSDL